MAKVKDIYDQDVGEVPLQQPEPEYISAKFKLRLPITDKHFADDDQLRQYAKALIEKKVGDEVQMTDMTVKMPGFLRKLVARASRRVPQAKLLLTVKF